MFSKRIGWELTQNPLSELLAAKKKRGETLLDLTLSNPTRCGLPYDEEAVYRALNQPGNMTYQPDPLGLLQAREAVVGYLLNTGGAAEAMRTVVTASTSEAYSWLFRVLCDDGDAVLAPRPSYPLFEFLAGLDGVRLLHYDLEYVHPAGWEIDFDSLEEAAKNPRVRAVLTVSPNNPTGSILRTFERERLVQFCASHGLALIADEVFADFPLDARTDAVRTLAGEDRCLTFALNGFSKVLGLPQLKFGWIAVSGPDDLAAEAMNRLELVADTFLSVGTPVQNAAGDLLHLRIPFQGALNARMVSNLAFLKSALEETPLRLLRCEGGWSAVIECPRFVPDEELSLTMLERENVLLYPGGFFQFREGAHLVVSLIVEPAALQEAVPRVLRFFRDF